ncbi:MAG TPA: hypothetical protein DD435_06810 [Cyanobacteria bacterium UBA8530]|nr:hypothetical protein [Cyanobacteria bacterium UBA8530]
MKPKISKRFFAMAMCLPLLGCGVSPSAVKTTTTLGSPSSAPTQNRVAAPVTQTADANDISKNPFVVWIKRSYPSEAARIIDDYLSQRTLGAFDPKVENERAKLRIQVIDTVGWELYKNMKAPNIPNGLVANKTSNAVWLKGTINQDGHSIYMEVPFMIKMDNAGLVWITQPQGSIVAHLTGFDPLGYMFGGNIPKKVHDEILKSLDKAGPDSSRKTPGLAYMPGGTFRVNPGEAFVKM